MAKDIQEKHFVNVPFSIDVKELENDSEFFEFEGYASTWDEDKVGDIVVKGAFANSVKSFNEGDKKLVCLWAHDRSMPLGIYTELKETDKGLFVKAKLPRSDTFVSGKVIPQLKVGSVTQMSIGFFIKEREFNEEGIRLLKEVDLFEISLVTIPANDKAVITDMKSLEEIESLKDVEEILKSKGFSNKQAEILVAKITEFKSLDCENQGRDEQTLQGELEGYKEFCSELNKLSSKLKQ